MIVVDIETSGGDFQKCGLWQIGALELENPENTFLEEARLDDSDEVINSTNLKNPRPVLEVIGKTEKQLRDKGKQSEKQLLANFFSWCAKINNRDLICHNPQFDYGFMWVKANKYGLAPPFFHRCFDLHSLAQLKYMQLKGNLLIKENTSDMGLLNLLKFVGMIDNRKAHNGLEDAKLEAEAFFRLVYGKKLLPEYSEFEIPNYLIQNKK